MKKETEKYIKDVADKLYDTIKDTNLNYIELENLLGIPDSTLNSYMNYKRVATIENIYKICSKLGVSSDYLLRLSPCKHLKNYPMVNKTGLTERSLEALESMTKYRPEEIETLNFLLSSDVSGIPFANFLYYLGEYLKVYKKSQTNNKRDLKARRIYAIRHNISYKEVRKMDIYKEQEFLDILDSLPPEKFEDKMDVSMYKAQRALQRLMDFSINEMHKKENEQPRIKKRTRKSEEKQ